MIEKFNTLLRVKILREERLLRDLQVKRQQTEEAAEAARQAERIVKESEETLPEREEAIYRKVYGKVVNLPGIDDLKEEVADLEKLHQRLQDKMDRAVHVLDRLEDELASAKLEYEQAARKRDKYSITTDSFASEALIAAEYREELEIEELFAKGRPKPS